MSSLKLDQLRTFAEVAERGGFSAAAEHIGISQPAVSLQVRQLERQLGVRLVERVGKRAQPTQAGAELLVHIRRIEEAAAAALSSIAPHRSGAVSRVRIGTGATACIYLLPAILHRLRERMPGLEITVRTGNTPDMAKLVETNAVDIGLVTLPVSGRAFEVTDLLDDELVAVLPAGEPLPREPPTPAFMTRKPLLLYEGGGNTRRIVDQWFARAGQAVRPTMELGSVEAIKELVGAGLGWAILPRMAVARGLEAGRIRAAPLSPPLKRRLGLVMRRDKHLGRGLREVIRVLEEDASAHR